MWLPGTWTPLRTPDTWILPAQMGPAASKIIPQTIRRIMIVVIEYRSIPDSDVLGHFSNSNGAFGLATPAAMSIWGAP
jgi:hypothetical protein